MTHVMEAKTSGDEKPQPVSWGRKGGCVVLSQKEPNNKHTLLQWASIAQVTKVPGDVPTTADLLGSQAGADGAGLCPAVAAGGRGGRIGREGNHRERSSPRCRHCRYGGDLSQPEAAETRCSTWAKLRQRIGAIWVKNRGCRGGRVIESTPS